MGALTSSLALALLFTPPAPGVPPPQFEAPESQAPPPGLIGPQPAPEEGQLDPGQLDPEGVADPNATEPDPSDASGPEQAPWEIQLAEPPPSEEPEPTPVDPALDNSLWPDPGTAPSDGIGSLLAGAILIPSAATMTYLLLDGGPIPSDDFQQISIVTTGTGMGAIGIGLLVMGGIRQHKLRRWAGAYRVRPTWQGSGMISVGSIALNYGLALTLGGIFGSEARGAFIGSGLGTLALAVPLLLLGQRQRQRYMRTGGWVRPPLPPIPVSPSVQLLPGGFSVGVGGRF